jgi:hypothetical protein
MVSHALAISFTGSGLRGLPNESRESLRSGETRGVGTKLGTVPASGRVARDGAFAGGPVPVFSKSVPSFRSRRPYPHPMVFFGSAVSKTRELSASLSGVRRRDAGQLSSVARSISALKWFWPPSLESRSGRIGARPWRPSTRHRRARGETCGVSHARRMRRR